MEFKACGSRISLINVYAPTDTTEEKIKQAFYEKLEEICEKIPK